MMDSGDNVQFREPTGDDGKRIWQLVKDTGVLDLNSAYSYMMLGRYFHSTCAVAERDGELVGFVSGFVPRERPDTLFIWQVAVAASERGRGLGKALFMELLKRESQGRIRFVEATVSPSNVASASLFRSLARELGTDLNTEECFKAEQFPGTSHEAEDLFRVGPFETTKLKEELNA